MMPTNVDGAPTRAEVVARYAAKSGLDVGDFSFYYCYGLFRLAVIVQQIYIRYLRGQTSDERFAPLGMLVPLLADQALALVDSTR